MPRIKVERVISVSSEDKLHVAENILNTDGNKKWKCKTVGEQNCTVILQLAELTVITGIDIGNEHSAFVEVHVGRTGFNDDDYKVLLMMSSFMTPLDSRQSENINRTRMFKTDDFCKPICEERWDRIKLICTQPFNRHVQYGLSFVTLHSAVSESTSTTKFGKFKINTETSTNAIAPGSIFSKLKTSNSPISSAVSAAAEIRKASLPSQITKNESLLSVKKDKIKKTSNPSTPTVSQSDGHLLNRNRRDILYDDEDDAPSQKVDKVMKNYNDKKQTNGNSDETPKKDSSINQHTPSTSKQSLLNNSRKNQTNEDEKTPKKESKTSAQNSLNVSQLSSNKKRRSSPNLDVPSKKVKVVKTKPFRELFRGVVFVMSGYQNPQRSNLRDMAIKLGAKYKPDWSDDCTHLICAFKNTPKYNEVRGRGKIVKSDWITECYNQRKRIPWRRFALDNREQIQSDSEEEILDELLDDQETAANTSASKKRFVVSSDSDTEDEIERVQAAQQMQDQNDGEAINDEIDADANANEKKDDSFDQDTDIEDNVKNAETIELKHLPEIFTDMKFHVADNLENDVVSELKRYIFAYGGIISNEIEYAEYLIIEDEELIQQFREQNTSIKPVRPAWIWECNDAKKLIEIDDFLIQ